MANRNFKLREQDYKAMLDMTEKQAGQFIKGLCGLRLRRRAYGNERRQDRVSVCVCKDGAGRIGQEPRERQKGRSARGGAYARSESVARQTFRSGKRSDGYVAERHCSFGCGRRGGKQGQKVSGILCADAAAGLKTLPPKSVQMCVTSRRITGCVITARTGR